MARLALLEHDDREAARLLADLPPPSTRRARVERAVLCALSVLERDVDEANRHLGDALVDGQPEWLIRTIVELGPDVHKLLVSFTPNVGQEAYVEALLAAASRGVAPLRPTVSVTLVDPLSAREVTVLRYLCSRLTYQEIAAALFVSVNTLKSHVRTRVPQARRGVARRRRRHRSTARPHLISPDRAARSPHRRGRPYRHGQSGMSSIGRTSSSSRPSASRRCRTPCSADGSGAHHTQPAHTVPDGELHVVELVAQQLVHLTGHRDR